MDRNLPGGVNRLLDNMVPKDAGRTVFSGVGPTAKSGGDLVRLYHGTSEEGLKGITTEGVFRGYMSPRQDVARDYGDQILELYVPKKYLHIDFDNAGSRAIPLEEANEYAKAMGIHDGDWDIDDYLRGGWSVATYDDVPIK